MVFRRVPRDEAGGYLPIVQAFALTQWGNPMFKLFQRSLISTCFLVVRFFLIDASASPAYAKQAAQTVRAIGCLLFP
jgi:hypothetical protein